MDKFGVIIGRMLPIHKGHIELIKQAAYENKYVLILLGSADKMDERNPLPIKLRHKMVLDVLDEYKLSDRVFIVDLDDLTTECDNSHDWGFYLYAYINKKIHYPYFTIYFSDGHEIITLWFPDFILDDFVSLKLNARGHIHKGLSATSIRKKICKVFDKHIYDPNNMPEYELSFFKKYLAKPVYDRLYLIYKYIKRTLVKINESKLFDDDLLDNDELTLDELNVADNISKPNPYNVLYNELVLLYGNKASIKKYESNNSIIMTALNPYKSTLKRLWLFFVFNHGHISIEKEDINDIGFTFSHYTYIKSNVSDCLIWFKKYQKKYLK